MSEKTNPSSIMAPITGTSCVNTQAPITDNRPCMSGVMGTSSASSTGPVPSPAEKTQSTPDERLSFTCISETPVTVCQESESLTDAPKKRMVYLRRVQLPVPEPLQEEWSLEPYGRSGVWGYLFKYETGELCLYQLKKNEMWGPANAVMTLTSNDWGVLRETILHQVREGGKKIWEECDDEEVTGQPSAKRLKTALKDPIPHKPGKSGFSAVWQSKTSPDGRWFLRVAILKNAAEDYILLQCLNSDCGVFRTLLSLPLIAFLEKMDEMDARFCNFFRQCRNWADLLVVKKTLAF